ncbi:MAG: cytochrome c oxidase accessory protein CcoG [Myxococcales bacterium]|nr:cytochrome c oxidase accessory protein CcoG [Myxococcales bacterium]
MFGAARKWIYPASIDGKFQRIHRGIGRSLIAFLLIAPWVRIGGAPILLADLMTRQVHVGGLVFTPRETVLLLTVILASGLLLFLVTSLWGRLWCGYACPQTVLMEELVRRIERWIEGERGAQIRLAEARLDATKLRKRLTKWALYLLLAAGIAFSFSGFFVDLYSMLRGSSPAGAYVFAGALTFVLFLDFAWFREQFCHYLCPYARLQSVLTDEHTVNIGYDFRRGEPRKPRGMKLSDLEGVEVGACIDCNRCVAVCPSGIDIRDGFQLECIACARCVDACIEVMDRLGQPTLVKYASLAELEGRPRRRFGVRPAIYAVALVGVSIVFSVTLLSRAPFDVTIAQDPHTAESALDNGGVRNLFQVTVHNKSQEPATFAISVTLDGAELVIPGAGASGEAQQVTVEGAGHRVVPAFVTLPSAADAPPITPFEFVVREGDTEVRHRATFRNHQRTGSK